MKWSRLPIVCIQAFLACLSATPPGAGQLSCVFALLACLFAPPPAIAQPVHPNIQIDNVNGVNGQASGAPGAQAAVFNANCCHTNGASSTTITCTGHGFGGFPVDGSAAIWIQTASGRRWSQVLGFPSGDTITVQDNFNIAAASAVDCAIGGEIAGTLANVTRLCNDLKSGWTATLQQTGVDYTDTGACNLAVTNQNIDQGRLVIQGDTPSNPPTILYGTNGSYFTFTQDPGLKIQYLHFRKNIAGTSGSLVGATERLNLLKGVRVSAATGTWATAYGPLSNIPGLVLLSQFDGPFTTACASIDDADFLLANFFNGCSGSAAAFVVSAPPWIMGNIIDQAGANQNVFFGTIGGGYRGVLLNNTILDGGADGVELGNDFVSIISGNYIDSAAALSGSCWDAGTGTSNWLGASGQPHILWMGNAARSCATARYNGGMGSTTFGAATDLEAGATFDAQFQDAPSLDFFPLNVAAKSALVLPGSFFPFQTAAAPVSTMTVGVAQRFGAGGGNAYGYVGP